LQSREGIVLGETISDRGLWVRRAGSGDRLLVLLHGMGANGAAWSRLLPILDSHWPGRVLVPDFRGHGRSVAAGPYGMDAHAADVAALVAGEKAQSVILIGHSFGGAVAARAASDRFGVPAQHVVAIGVKIRWSEPEIARAHELARRPARSFAAREEAVERYLKISGLAGLADPASEAAAAGVLGEPGAWRVAVDPGVFAAVGPSVPAILQSCTVPLHLAAGENDPMVSLADLRTIDPTAIAFAGRGHSVHWEAPQEVWEFIASMVAL
jgi:pimeloyl-ACP methyl ester carboxylesterase